MTGALKTQRDLKVHNCSKTNKTEVARDAKHLAGLKYWLIQITVSAEKKKHKTFSKCSCNLQKVESPDFPCVLRR